MRAQYTKLGDLRFTSHLDLTRVIERAVRRAQLPIAYSEGFHPKPKIAYGPALALGITSRVELADFQLARPTEAAVFQQKLNAVLPQGCQITKVAPVPENEPALTTLIDRAAYRITVDPEVVPSASTLSKAVQDILEQETVIVQREKKGRRRRVDIRPYLIDLVVSQTGEGKVQVDALLQIGSAGATNPKEVLGLFGLELAQPGVAVERTGLYTCANNHLVELI